jgi:superfamily II DNA/RNA helicase
LTSFDGFGLNEAITRAIAEERYATPTPIQEQTIPIVMSRRDVMGIAQTGTGKTAAFALPILHYLVTGARPPGRKSCRTLVLCPTRELSGQVLDSFRAYGRHLSIRSALAIGGVSMGGQARALLNGVDALVATPGRLLDLVKSNSLHLSGVEFLVIDEADHGNKSQGQRERVLASFRKGDVKTLVATDIAARGLDVDGISHVVKFDLPNVPETYVHRIGRTARAGAKGVAISLCDAEEAGLLRDIEKLIRKAIPATDRRTHSDRPQMTAPRSHPAPRSTRSSGNRQRQRYGDAPARSDSSHKQRSGRAERRNGEREQADDSSSAIAYVAFLRHSAPRREQA